ncbi:hypothetical protein RYB01_23590 [Pseudomonas syringae]|nr:hypothetical protein [Pseudomonas syringae]
MPKSEEFILSEDERIDLLITQARNAITPHDIFYKADWLKEGTIGSKMWIVRESGTGIERNIDFSRFLADGSNLTDPENMATLGTVQRCAFHMRQGDIGGSYTSHARWVSHIHGSLTLGAWLYLYKTKYRPDEFGFSNLDEEGCKFFFEKFSTGGLVEVMSVKERFLTMLHSATKSQLDLEELLASPYILPDVFLKDCKAWLDNEKYYTGNSKGEKWLSRKKLAARFGITTMSLCQNDKARCFLLQFETSNGSQTVLAKRGETYGKSAIHQNCRTREEALLSGTKVGSLKDLRVRLQHFFDGHEILPSEVPNINLYRGDIVDLGHEDLDPNGHTRLIPIEIGLELINQAIRWVFVYGEAIADSLPFYAERYKRYRAEEAHDSGAHSRMKDLFNTTINDWPITSYTEATNNVGLGEALKIIGVNTRESSLETLESLSYQNVVDGFYGACALLVAMCKPIREGELHDINVDCLSKESKNGGVLLHQIVNKSGPLGIKSMIKRPIPFACAKAVQLLQVLNHKLSTIFEDSSDNAQRLFYIPSNGLNIPKFKSKAHIMNRCINIFCMIADLPRDKHGRQWLARVHEMRKFFVLIMHKHHQNSLREILSNAAGQIDPDHIDEYFKFDEWDAEAIHYEAECIGDKLIALELNQLEVDNNQGLLALHHHVCEHFNVSRASAISPHEFGDLLEILTNSGEYASVTYTAGIENYEHQFSTIEFAVKFGAIKDANFP